MQVPVARLATTRCATRLCVPSDAVCHDLARWLLRNMAKASADTRVRPRDMHRIQRETLDQARTCRNTVSSGRAATRAAGTKATTLLHGAQSAMKL